MTQNSAIQIFSFEANQVRVVFDDRGEPWWVAVDVCRSLGINRYHDAIARLENNDKRRVKVEMANGPQKVTAISEPGLYHLVFSSRKPEAERFKNWITRNVLSQIRKTGSFSIQKTPEPIINVRDPVAVNNLCRALADYNNELLTARDSQ